MKKINRIQVSEKQRTIILVVLLIIGLGFLVFVQTSVESNFVEQL